MAAVAAVPVAALAGQAPAAPRWARGRASTRTAAQAWRVRRLGGLGLAALVGGRARVARRAYLAESVAADARSALNEVLAAAPKEALVLLLIPRRFAAEAQQLVQQATQSLPGVQLAAFITGGQSLQLGTLNGPPGSIKALSLSPDSPDAGLASFASAGSVLVLADPSVSPPALGRTLEAIQKKWPNTTTAGLVAAPGNAPGAASVWLNGVAAPVALLVLPSAANAALDLAGCAPVGQEMEIFEASAQRGKGAELLQIGTDQEGDYQDAAETEKGTAGIPRRVGIPAAAALKSVMQANNISGPKEMLLGLSRPGGSGPLAARWALFNWVGVSPSGACQLAGGDPLTEGLMPTGALRRCQAFRLTAAGPDWQRLVAATGAGKTPALTLVAAGGRNLSPKEAAASAGRALGALGVAVLGANGGGLAVHRQAGLVLALYE